MTKNGNSGNLLTSSKKYDKKYFLRPEKNGALSLFAFRIIKFWEKAFLNRENPA